jgi:hypothetical protein
MALIFNGPGESGLTTHLKLTPLESCVYNELFEELDVQGQEVISRGTALRVFQNSGLPIETVYFV